MVLSGLWQTSYVRTSVARAPLWLMLARWPAVPHCLWTAFLGWPTRAVAEALLAEAATAASAHDSPGRA